MPVLTVLWIQTCLHVVVVVVFFFFLIAVECLLRTEVGLKMEVIILCHLKLPSSSRVADVLVYPKTSNPAFS